jgi:hypothetical protein
MLFAHRLHRSPMQLGVSPRPVFPMASFRPTRCSSPDAPPIRSEGRGRRKSAASFFVLEQR